MPELPEVETTRLGLLPLLENRCLAAVTLRRTHIRTPIPPDFIARTTGKKITRITRRAKYILIHLNSGDIVIIHLGMSGRMTQCDYGAPPGKHDHVIFTTDKQCVIAFNDPRRFGVVDIIDKQNITNHRYFSAMGIEPLGDDFTPAHLHSMLHNKKTPIKTALLDQRVVAGLGNIYVCEALYGARLHPAMPAHSITRAQCQALVPAIKKTLNAALDAGGSSLRDFQHTNGKLGYFQHHFRVYDQAGKPCVRRACDGIISRITQAGRSSFFCPRCQKK